MKRPIVTKNMIQIRVSVDEHLLDLAYDKYKQLLAYKYNVDINTITTKDIKAHIFDVGLQVLDRVHKNYKDGVFGVHIKVGKIKRGD